EAHCAVRLPVSSFSPDMATQYFRKAGWANLNYFARHEWRNALRLLRPTCNVPRRLGTHSAFAPESLTTRAHFSVSLAKNVAKSAGEPGSGVPPSSAMRAFIRGSAKAALSSLLSRSTISAGVPAGAAMPYHALAS